MVHFPVFLIGAWVLECLDISCSWQMLYTRCRREGY